MTIWLWGGFVIFVLGMLALDLGIVNRRGHVVSAREAVVWTFVCIGLALGFNVLVYFMYANHWLGIGQRVGEDLTGYEAAQQYFAGWLVEYSLSLDNIFVIALVFRYFRVPRDQQHRVLFWGILGALIMRGAMIGAGAALIRLFRPTEYIFGGIVLWSAWKMLMAGDEEPHPEKGWVVRTARRLLPIGPGFEGDRFFTTVNGRRAMTPLFLVLLVVETTDVVFAVDSIPAIFAITEDPFLVFTSNVFAILGLRSLYFALAAVMDKFRYLKTSLVFVLGFVGVKMLAGSVIEVPTMVSLAIILAILACGLLASAFASRRARLRREPPIVDLTFAAERAWKRARRMVILVVGLTIIFVVAPLTGLIPGPGGIPVAIAGLALLATEFVWARSLLNSLKARALALASKAEVMVAGRPRPWLIAPVALIFVGIIVGVMVYEPRWRLWVALMAIGPGIAIGYWATTTIRRWQDLRSPPTLSTPDADPPSEA